MEVLSLEKADIDAEYDRLKFGHGYSFLLCDEARLTDADVAIVGLNPGGREDFDGYQKIGPLAAMLILTNAGPTMIPNIVHFRRRSTFGTI